MKPPKPIDRKQKEFMQIWRAKLEPEMVRLFVTEGFDAAMICQHIAWTLFKLMREHRKN